jgi:hypothetical protein
MLDQFVQLLEIGTSSLPWNFLVKLISDSMGEYIMLKIVHIITY